MSKAKEWERHPPPAGAAVMQVVESHREIRQAVADWKTKLERGSEEIGRLRGAVRWIPDHRFWVMFDRTDRNGYWNLFGLTPTSFRNNMVVEINPQLEGIDTDVQGTVAMDAGGRRWLLHKGRLKIGSRHLTGEEFARLSELVPGYVRFSNGETFRCHPVACIDEHADLVQRRTVAFVRRCALARAQASGDRTAAAESAQLLLAETGGDYVIPARPATKATRFHTAVWKELERCLKERKLTLANRRAMGLGPDLYCCPPSPRILFEIKTGAMPTDIYEAIGQLFAYDYLLGGNYKKVVVLPKRLSDPLRRTLEHYKITILFFERPGGRAKFRAADIANAIAMVKHRQ